MSWYPEPVPTVPANTSLPLACYAFVGEQPPPCIWYQCPFCPEKVYSPASPWIEREIETLGCGTCEQSVKGDARQEAIGEINDGWTPPKESA